MRLGVGRSRVMEGDLWSCLGSCGVWVLVGGNEGLRKGFESEGVCLDLVGGWGY